MVGDAQFRDGSPNDVAGGQGVLFSRIPNGHPFIIHQALPRGNGPEVKGWVDVPDT
jgi:hypothetical protein